MTRSLLKAVLINVAILAAYWRVAFSIVHASEFLPASTPPQIAEVIAGALALTLAFALRARVATYLVAAFLAFSTAELAINLIYGARSIHGAPMQFAVLGAALIGVALGVLAMRVQMPRAEAH